MIFFEIFQDFSPQATHKFAAGERRTRRRRHPLQVFAVPVDGFGDAAGEVVLGMVAEQTLRLADVGVGVLDVARALRSERGRDILAERLHQRLVNVDQVLAAAIRDVESLAGSLVGARHALRLASITFST